VGGTIHFVLHGKWFEVSKIRTAAKTYKNLVGIHIDTEKGNDINIKYSMKFNNSSD